MMAGYPRRLIRSIAATALMGPLAATAAYQTGDLVLVRERLQTDSYLAGRTVEVLAPVDGDLVAAGQRVTLSAPMASDVIAAGETVEIGAPVADDIRAAGRVVRIVDTVGGHVVAAGADVQLGPRAQVADWAWLAGANVLVAGRVGSGLKAAGNRVVIAGTVQGDAEVFAESVELLSGARVSGDLIVRSDEKPSIADGAVVDGRVVVQPLPGREEPGAGSMIGGAVMFGLLLAVTAGAIYLLVPQYAHAAGGEVRTAPLKTLGLGLAVLVGVPLLVLLLIVTGVGAMLGLALLALYVATLVVGFSSGVMIVGDWGLRAVHRSSVRRGLGLLAVVLAAIAVALLWLIPVLGSLLVLLLMLAGIGALTLRLWRHYRVVPAVGAA